jgi:hypothetical protein
MRTRHRQAGDVDVRSTDLVTRRQVGQRQRHVDVAGHQLQHAAVKTAQPQANEVGQSPAGFGELEVSNMLLMLPLFSQAN